MSRFTLRDLFWLTLVVGLALGWWLHSTKLSESVENLNERAETARQELYVLKITHFGIEEQARERGFYIPAEIPRQLHAKRLIDQTTTIDEGDVLLRLPRAIKSESSLDDLEKWLNGILQERRRAVPPKPAAR